jgi:hypothetical protein
MLSFAIAVALQGELLTHYWAGAPRLPRGSSLCIGFKLNCAQIRHKRMLLFCCADLRAQIGDQAQGLTDKTKHWHN